MLNLKDTSTSSSTYTSFQTTTPYTFSTSSPDPEFECMYAPREEYPSDVETWFQGKKDWITELKEKKVPYNAGEMEWDGQNDPGNPYNWSKARRWYLTATVALLTLAATVGSSIYVGATAEMMEKWNISQTLALAGVSMYVIGMAFGPAIAAPLSEVFGRKIVYCCGIPITACFTVGVGLSTGIAEFLVLRFFAALSSSGALSVVAGTINDIWQPRERGVAMSLVCVAPMMGPVLGPIIGGFVSEYRVSDDPKIIGSLRWTMWVNLMFYAAVIVPIYLAPETYKQTILKRRLRKQGLEISRRPTMASVVQFLTQKLFITLLKPMEMLVVEPIVFVLSLYTAVTFSVLFGFFETYPVIFRGIYGMSLENSGLPFIGAGIGLIIGTLTFLMLDQFYYFRRWPDGYVGMKKNGLPVSATPESRLLGCMLGSFTLSPSLFWLAWTSRSDINYLVPAASGILFGFSMIQIFLSVLTYFVLSYPTESVASSLAANNILRYLVAFPFPLFTVQMMKKLHVYWGVTVLAFIALILAPAPWVFMRYGPYLRNVSKYGYSAKKAKAVELS
ncbi:DEKNAAC103174 [Brettanomyces naardenensis]|uniref:DEKNAAC103174 n=1 Tax=Brettanomyces naardenensis TaxID=13370 RepID=A0A448YMI3_BRENA|nr:DEKNAAC103174 [Brettanomyces naardenensis]